ncbi:MAG: RNA pyrophosphohydrolase [Candidatus Puniceispirillaceae bacterium]
MAESVRPLEYSKRPYRPCVGIMLINDNGHIFGGQRIDNRAEAWQMPQGGIDAGEDVETACFREMREEIGTDKADILSIHPEWLNYDIPLPLADRLWGGSYRGQSQKWVALRYTGQDSDINIATVEPEFFSWQWMSPADLIQLAVPFKRPVYEDIMTQFAQYIKAG